MISILHAAIAYAQASHALEYVQAQEHINKEGHPSGPVPARSVVDCYTRRAQAQGHDNCNHRKMQTGGASGPELMVSLHAVITVQDHTLKHSEMPSPQSETKRMLCSICCLLFCLSRNTTCYHLHDPGQSPMPAGEEGTKTQQLHGGKAGSGRSRPAVLCRAGSPPVVSG